MLFHPILKEQREELEQIEREENIIERDKHNEAKNLLEHPNILAVLGIRRCGKSVFSYLLAKDSMGYVNFDDERLAGLKGQELNNILQSIYELYGDVKYLVLDEVQNVDNWELFANRLRRTKRVILTGSNSKLLSGELATHLTGRYVSINLFPFSFQEFLRFKRHKLEGFHTTKEKAMLLTLLREYLETGGLPEAYKFGKSIIARIYDDIITKDLLLRYKIKRTADLRQLARYLVTNSAEEFTYGKLAKIFGIKHISTVSNWVSYLENSFLLFKIDRFDFKLKKQFLAPKKIYCVDTGIINTVGFKFSEDTGRIIENAVAVELQRRITSAERKEIYYWKDHLQNEVDFVVKEGKRITQLIQVAYATKRNEIRRKELTALVKAGRELRCRNLLVITWDCELEERVGGFRVRFVPLWKWLLGEPR
ncbi:MAG: ATP-binding protein [Candidatus Micrarchaeia archaeon]